MFNWEIFWSIIGIFVGVGVVLSLSIVTVVMFDKGSYILGWTMIIGMLVGAAVFGGLIG